jgi:hypothetical protein
MNFSEAEGQSDYGTYSVNNSTAEDESVTATSFSLKVTPATGYDVDSVTLNGTTVAAGTGNATEGYTYSLTATDGANVVITYKEKEEATEPEVKKADVTVTVKNDDSVDLTGLTLTAKATGEEDVTATASDGTYTFKDLKVGTTYTLSASELTGATTAFSSNTVTVAEGGNSVTLTVTAEEQETSTLKTINDYFTITPSDNTDYVNVVGQLSDNNSDRWKLDKLSKGSYIEFKLGQKSKVIVTQASSSQKTIYVSSSKETTANGFSTTSSSPITLDAGTYYIYNTSGNMYIYSIEIKSAEATKYTASINNIDDYPQVKFADGTTTLTSLTTDDTEVTVKWDATEDYIAGEKTITLPESVDSSEYVYQIDVDASWFKKAPEKSNIKVYVNDELVDGYESLEAAIADVNNGTYVNATITLADGTYEIEAGTAIKIEKAVTIKKADENGSVTITGTGLDNEGDCSGMNPLVWVTGDGVTLDGLEITNTRYQGEKFGTGEDNVGAALAVDASNCTFTNLHLIGVQDTVYISQTFNKKGTTTQLTGIKFDGCTIDGDTDWICGAGEVTFDNCTFNYLDYKDIGYIFAPSIGANWTVNGGTVSGSLKDNSDKRYYARFWNDTGVSKVDESNGVSYPALNIYDLTLSAGDMCTTDGLMGFKGVLSGRSETESQLVSCDFNVYSGSELIATTKVDIITDIFSQYGNGETLDWIGDTNDKLVVTNFKGGSTLNENTVIEADKYGFWFVDADTAESLKGKTSAEIATAFNAATDKVTIESSKLYTAIVPDDDTEKGLTISEKITNPNGYFGVCKIIEGSKLEGMSVYFIPYVMFDGSYTEGSTTYSKDLIYNFGDVQIANF